MSTNTVNYSWQPVPPEVLAEEYCNPVLSHNPKADANSFLAGHSSARLEAEELVSAVEKTIAQMNAWSCSGCSTTLSPVALESVLARYRGGQS